MSDLATQKAQQESEQQSENAKIEDFRTRVSESPDLEENLSELTTFLKSHLNATCVSVGHRDYRRMEVDDDAEEDDHLDRDSPQVIELVHSTDASMKGQILWPDEAPITFGVFNQQVTPAEPLIQDNDSQNAEVVQSDLPQSKQYVYVPEVVREDQMWF